MGRGARALIAPAAIASVTGSASTLTMSTREIAELTGKLHPHVIRDTRTMLDQLGDEPNLDHVREEKDARGYTACFHLPKDLTLTLVAGYSVPLRHDNVMADARAMLEQLGMTSPEFSGHLPDAYGRPQPVFNLPKDLTLTLVAGYSVPLRHKIVTRWIERPTKKAPRSQPWGLSYQQAELMAVIPASAPLVVASVGVGAAAVSSSKPGKGCEDGKNDQ